MRLRVVWDFLGIEEPHDSSYKSGMLTLNGYKGGITSANDLSISRLDGEDTVRLNPVIGATMEMFGYPLYLDGP